MMNRLSTSVGIVSELGVLGGGPPSSCMNYTWLGSTIMKAFKGNKPSLLKGFLKSLPKRLRFDTSSLALRLWTIWIERNDRVFNLERWHKSKSKHLIWDNLISYAKVAWAKVVKYVKVSTYPTKALLKGFNQTWDNRHVLCRHDKLKKTVYVG